MSANQVTLQRGNTQHEDSQLVIRSSTKPLRSAETNQLVLDIEFGHKPTVLLNQNPIQFTEEKNSLLILGSDIEEPFSSLLIHVHRTPWDDLFDFNSLISKNSRILSIATSGWHQNTWYSGPLAFFQNSRVNSWVPSGGAASLTVDINSASGISIDKVMELEGTPSELMQRCLVAATEQLVDPKHLTFSIVDFDLTDALAIVLCRRAFPNGEISLCSPIQYGNFTPPWRRLCQNLGISTAEQSSSIPLGKIAQIIPKTRKNELLDIINAKSPLIPTKIGEKPEANG